MQLTTRDNISNFYTALSTEARYRIAYFFFLFTRNNLLQKIIENQRGTVSHCLFHERIIITDRIANSEAAVGRDVPMTGRSGNAGIVTDRL